MKIESQNETFAPIARRGPVADTMDQIFEPLRFETLSDVFADYARDLERMRSIAAIFDGENAAIVDYFVAANVDRGNLVSAERLFALEPAIKALDSSYWQRALQLTDILDSMPQKRRDEWHELVRQHETPPFTQDSVASTLQDLLVQRHAFFSERVDGIFRALSHQHVTNRPEGFSKRMIIAYVYDGLGVNISRAGTINDLRIVISKFMGRQEPRYYDTSRALEYAQRERCGEWTVMDGGALRLRAYKNGNAHLEVHPEMAWRLNAVLASMYPNAIPEEHRRRPNRRMPKDFAFYSRPLPMPVMQMLADGRVDHGGRRFALAYDAKKQPAYGEACDVLQMLGGDPRPHGDFVFDYAAGPVIREVAISGMIPDQRSHQFYPTPTQLAARAVAAAQIQPHHSILEPSAGHGALASMLPAGMTGNTTLVEVAALFCEVLKAKGLGTVIKADFLRWSPGRRFDRVLMNPPFTGNAWRMHLEHAASLVAGGGRLVAVLPSGARSRDLLPGWACTWSDPEPFPGTSIEVVLLVADHGGAQ